MDIYIEQTPNPHIIKFVAPRILVKKGYEFAQGDDISISPLAQKLFQFPFVKKIIISTNIVALEKSETIDWEDVANDLKILIHEFYQNDQILKEEANKVEPYSLYAEITPNPKVMKFVANRLLFDGLLEYKSVDETQPNTFASAIFQLPFIQEVFITENYIALTKKDDIEWNDITLEARTFLLDYLQSGKMLFNDKPKSSVTSIIQENKVYTAVEEQIKAILEEYVKPAVSNDGGNIELVNFEEESKTAVMLLQGACSGCPSSTATLKNGIETMLKDMMPNVVEKVEAING